MSRFGLKPAPLKNYVDRCPPQALKIVLDIFHKRPLTEGLSTREIFDIATKDPGYDDHSVPAPPPKLYPEGVKGRGGKTPIAVPEPPFPNHPIRSMRFLKTVVLKEMAARKQIEKVTNKRPPMGIEITDIKKRAMKIQRRNARKMEKGEEPNGVVPETITEWIWRLRMDRKPQSVDEGGPSMRDKDGGERDSRRSDVHRDM